MAEVCHAGRSFILGSKIHELVLHVSTLICIGFYYSEHKKKKITNVEKH